MFSEGLVLCLQWGCSHPRSSCVLHTLTIASVSSRKAGREPRFHLFQDLLPTLSKTFKESILQISSGLTFSVLGLDENLIYFHRKLFGVDFKIFSLLQTEFLYTSRFLSNFRSLSYPGIFLTAFFHLILFNI